MFSLSFLILVTCVTSEVCTTLLLCSQMDSKLSTSNELKDQEGKIRRQKVALVRGSWGPLDQIPLVLCPQPPFIR